MIGIDTNILARAILDDDKLQSPQAQNFLEKHSKEANLYISPFTILELAWLLKSKGLAKHEIAYILEKLIYTHGINVGSKNIIIAALDSYKKNNLSFADCLISVDNQLSMNARTATFDQALCKANKYCFIP